jgi:hypothetical protein
MKNVIKKLEQIKASIRDTHFFSRGAAESILDEAVMLINEVIEELKTPRFYTPEQREAETGEPWPENGAVYFLADDIDAIATFWGVCRYKTAKQSLHFCVCATEAGAPPDDWRPEEEYAK